MGNASFGTTEVQHPKPESLFELIKPIRCFLTDVDGVMTTGQIFLGEDGEWKRLFNLYDGMGLKRLKEAGFLVGFVTTSKSSDIRKRREDLGLQIFYEGISDKITVLPEILSTHGLKPQEIAYIGDDIPDIEIMKAVGVSATVPHALEAVKRSSRYITQRQAGFGAVREWAEMILAHSEKQN